MDDPSARTAKKSESNALDILLIFISVVFALFARNYYMPVESKLFPGINGFPTAKNNSPAPSIDELWHLALSTGWGDLYSSFPVNQLIKDVPPLTNVETARPWYTVWTSMNYVVHPPLYVQTIRLWRNVTGSSDMAAVWFSISWSCVAVMVTFLNVRLHCRSEIAFVAAIVMAISPTEIYYAIEIRGYAMLTAVILALIYVTQLLIKKGAKKGLCVVLSVLLLISMLTHYLALPTCLACGIVLFIYVNRADRKGILIAGISSAIVYVICWLPFVIQQYHHVHSQDTEYLKNTMGILPLIEKTLHAPLFACWDGWKLTTSSNLIGLTMLIGIFWFGLKNTLSRPIALVLGFNMIWLLAGDLIRDTQLLSFVRYFAPILALLIPSFFISLCNQSIPHGRIIAWAGLLLIIAGIVTPIRNFPINYDSPAYAPMIQYYARYIETDETIVIACKKEEVIDMRWLLLELSHIPGLFPRDIIMLDQPMDNQTVQQIRSNKIWLITPLPKDTPSYWLPGYDVMPQRWKMVPNMPAYELMNSKSIHF